MQKLTEQKIIKLNGVTCTACENKIEKAISKLDGVLKINVSYASSTADITFNPKEIDISKIYDTIKRTGYDVVLDDHDIEEESSRTTTLLICLIIAGLYVIINNTVGFNLFPQITQNMGYGMLFIAGLFTSVHCIAMCGGINLSQCAGCSGCENNNIYSKLKPSFLYNLGRVTSYTVLGGVVGAIGSAFSISLKGKALISLMAGAFMIVMGINMLGLKSKLRKIMPRLPKSPLGIDLNQGGKSANAVIKDNSQTVTTKLESGRYQPITVYAGAPLKWTIVAEKGTLNGCNNEIIIPQYGIQQKLELGENIIEFTPTQAGIITYTCWMGMISNTITVQ